MNVLELCLSTDLGGLELYVYRSSKALANSPSKNNKVHIVLAQDGKLNTYFKDHPDKSIPRTNFHYIKRFFNPLPLLNARKLAANIDKNNIDVIHIHWGKDLPLAAFAKAFSRKKPALVYTRQMMITRAKNDFYHNFLYQRVDLLLTITKELEHLCRKFIPLLSDKTTTLYYGVNKPEKILNIIEIQQQRQSMELSKQDFVVGLIGRLEESKGQHLLIEALHQSKNNGHNMKALVIGHEMAPGYRDTLKKQASKLGVLDNIVFLDFTSKPQQLMQICDCVVLASTQETFGLVLPEAMRAGVAVIGSNSGGVPEIIDHESTGLLFKTKNAVDLQLQLERLFLDTEFKDQIAAQGKLSADKRFSNNLHFEKLELHLSSI